MNCTLCKFTFAEPRTVPRVLPCGHSFCEACLKLYAISNRGFGCNRCGTYFSLDSVKDAPINIDLLLMNNALSKREVINESSWNTLEDLSFTATDRPTANFSSLANSQNFYTPTKEMYPTQEISKFSLSSPKLTPVKDMNRNHLFRPEQKCIIEDCFRRKYVDPNSGEESLFCSEECWNKMNNINPFLKQY